MYYNVYVQLYACSDRYCCWYSTNNWFIDAVPPFSYLAHHQPCVNFSFFPCHASTHNLFCVTLDYFLSVFFSIYLFLQLKWVKTCRTWTRANCIIIGVFLYATLFFLLEFSYSHFSGEKLIDLHTSGHKHKMQLVSVFGLQKLHYLTFSRIYFQLVLFLVLKLVKYIQQVRCIYLCKFCLWG